MTRQRIDYRSRPENPRSASSSNTRGTAIVTSVVIWLVLVLAYAASAWAMAVYRLLIDGGVLVLWLAAAWGIGSAVLPLFAGDDEESGSTLLRETTAIALGLGILSLTTLGLGLAAWLNQSTAVALLAAGALAGAVTAWRKLRILDKAKLWLAAPAGCGWLALIGVPFAALMTVGGMLPPYLLWSPQEPHGYDVVEYHLQVPREWFEAGRIVPLHHNVFSFFPFNIEMHYLLAMHLRGGPWAGMYLAQFMHGAFMALSVLAACGLAGRLAPRAKGLAALIAALAMISTPWITQLGSIAYDEGGFCLFGVLAIGWAMLALRNPASRLRRFALSGAMAGFACGSKLTAVPEVLVGIAVVSIALLLVIPSGQRAPLLPGVAGISAFGLAGIVCFGPWLLRTWAWSGNPVFPELPSLFGRGHFSDVQVERWHRAHSPRPDQRSIRARLRASELEILNSWQFGFFLIPAALVSIVVNQRSPDVWFGGAMLFLLALFWLFFTHLQSRFFILAVPVCALLVARLSWPGLAVVIIQAAIALVSLNVHFFTPDRRQIISEALGSENLAWLTPTAANSVPSGGTFVLVGDAKAFLYQRPMSLLRYRTIFDADTSEGRGVIEAWGGPGAARGTEYMLIDPNELRRFEKTYQPFPPLPADIASHDEPYLIQR